MLKQQKNKINNLGSFNFSDEMKDTFFNLSRDLICIVGMDGYFKYVNPAWEKLLGYTEKELLSKPFHEFIHPEDLVKTEEGSSRFSKGESILYFENRYICKNGSIKHIQWTGTLLPVEDIIYGIGRDITESKQFENALLVSEQRFRSMFEKHNAVMLLIEPDSGKIIDSNRSATNFYGYSRDELISMKIADINLLVPEEIKRYRKLAQAEDVNFFSFKHRLKNNIIRDVEVHSTPIEYMNQKLLFSIIFNITDRIRAEEKLRKSDIILNSTTDIVITTDLEGTVTYTNKAVKALYGYEPEELVGKPVSILWKKENVPHLQSSIHDLIDGKSINNQENVYVDKQGNEIPVICSLIGIKDDKGKVVELLGITKEIITLKEAQQSLEESEEKFRTLFKESPIPTFTWQHVDADFVLRDYNTAALAFTKGTIADFVGKKASALLRDYDEHLLKDFEHCIQKKSTIMKELFYIMKRTGERKYLHVRYVYIPPDIVMLHAEDFTESKQAEGKLEKERNLLNSIIDNIPIMLTRYDPDANMLYLNRAFEKIVGWTTEEVKNIDIMEKVYPDPDYRQQAMEFKQKASTEWREFQVQCKSGKIIDSEWASLHLDDGTQIGIGIDISERKRAEEKLSESEKRFSSIFKSSLMAIALTRHSDNQLSEVNQAWLDLSGFQIDEVINKTPLDLNLYVNAEQRKHMVNELQAKGRIDGFDFQLRNKTGEIADLLFSAELIELGSEQYILSMAQDITERIRAEEKLRKSDIILNTTIDTVITTDLKGKITYVNAAVKVLSGYEPKELVGKHVSILWKKENIPYLQRSIQDLIDGKSINNMENVCVDKQGNEIPVISSLIGIRDDKGKVVELLGITKEIITLKEAQQSLEESEEKYRLLHENAGLGIGYYTPEGVVLSYNSIAAKDMNGVPEDFAGKSIFDLFPKDAANFYFDRINKAVITDKITVYEDFITLPTQDKWFLSTYTKIVNSKREISGIQIISQDITEIKNTEEALIKMQEELRNLTIYLDTKVEEEKKNIAREMHDGLGQLLTGLKLNISLLGKNISDKQDSALRLDDIKKILDSGIQLVQNITKELRPVALDDLGIIAAIYSYIQDLEETSGIKTNFNCNPLDFYVDPDLSISIYKICVEILTNIIRHAKTKKVTIKFRKFKTSLSLVIRDFGIGITAEQISSSLSFGLIGIRERLNIWNGTMKMEGIPGKGTTIKIWIPLSDTIKNSVL